MEKQNIEKKQHREKGFLSFIAILIIVVISFVIVAATYQFTTDSRTSMNQLSSNQAFYLAQSGLNAAQHVIITNNNSCTSINGTANFTDAAFTGANGTYTVTGASTSTASTLNGNITASATTITLASTSGFASSGVVMIDSEYINYMGISGNSLTSVTRGVGGTTAASHSSGAAVLQSQCVLTSAGYVPNSSSFTGKRVLQEIIPGKKTFSIGGNNAVLFGVGNVSLNGNSTVANPSVTASSSNFTGSTIVSAGSVSLGGSSQTQVSDGSGSLVNSSVSGGTLNADVQQNTSAFTSSNLFSYFFNQSKATIQANANQSYTSSNLNGATFQSAGNKIIWIGSDLSLNSNSTIGSLSSPVILIVNGNATLSGNVTINGLLYVTGNLSFTGNSTINGLIGVEGTAIQGTGSSFVNLNTTTLSNIFSQSSNVNATYKYTAPYASQQELLP